MRNHQFYQAFISAMVLILTLSCGKETPDPDNPFNNISQVPSDSSQIPYTSLDSSDITALHQQIFQPKCAIPSCHGGVFEPDFRTVESTYNTLVYQEVIKNNDDYEFRFRVVPYDTAASWLHERLLTDDEVLGRMPRYAPPLNATEMRHINEWILNGAKDINGDVAVRPDINVGIYGYDAYDLDGNLVSNNRPQENEPFVLENDQIINMVMFVFDDEKPSEEILYNKLKISTNPDDFSNPVRIIDAVFNWDYYVWVVQLNGADFETGVQYYFRYYARDAEHQTPVEFPNNRNNFYYTKGYCSFIVQ